MQRRWGGKTGYAIPGGCICGMRKLPRKRYNRETLEVRYRGRNISEVLELTVAEAKDLFMKHPAIVNKLETLDAVDWAI